jgi:FKBP12-rapamycin complex-associated protein
MVGSDGNEYSFLLKAHEDTRLDERVMQLFSFINTFVAASHIPHRDKFSVATYKVIPVTNDVGLIGWVENCNTLFDIIRVYREQNKIDIECEFSFVKKKFPNYDNLPIKDKVRAYEAGLKVANGMELKTILLQQSVDSHHWLERRANFTASLAMTSMAGYLLGLGDRHMMNIMMKTRTAKLVHIDFGDCFEVAQNRSLFPEKVPFRLSRQLTNALEVAGIRGTFRIASQNIVSLLRQNADHIVGILSVFTYDPIRQLALDEKLEVGESEQSGPEIMGRIADKLNGDDIHEMKGLSVEAQVDLLIEQATSATNLCQMFKGWYAWW